jgi:acyl-homoserine lactone acylase PvdQ
VPDEDKPYVIDPPKGFVALGNNKFIATSNKYNLGWNTIPTARGLRVHDALAAVIA